jgi:hypothetical protein
MALRIGCCITPHGFGHAARISAVMEATGALAVSEFVVATTVPRWFFTRSLSVPFSYNRLTTDIGLVQKSSLLEDLQATLHALADFYPLAEERVDHAVHLFSTCDLILCDIAPLGIVAAERLGIPSLLMENFTWDWIYTKYLEQFPALGPHIDYLREIYCRASYHFQTAPVCQPSAGLKIVPPVSRSGRKTRAEIRRQLQVSDEDKLILITMGGVVGDEYAVRPLQQERTGVFVLAGKGETVKIEGNVRWIAQNSKFYHPDLIAASDLVVGKVGYSTLAEIYSAGVPFGYIRRDSFRESHVLVDFINRERAGLEISAVDFKTGKWLRQLPELFTLQAKLGKRDNGAAAIAQYIVDVLSDGGSRNGLELQAKI